MRLPSGERNLERKEERLRLTGDVEVWMGGREDMTRCRYPASSIQDGGGWGEGGEIEGVGLDVSQINRRNDGHPWRSMRYGDIMFRQGEPEIPPVGESNRVVGTLFQSSLSSRGNLAFKPASTVQGTGSIPNATVCARIHCTTKDSPSPKNGMGIMTKSPRATLFRGDEAQSPGSRVTPA